MYQHLLVLSNLDGRIVARLSVRSALVEVTALLMLTAAASGKSAPSPSEKGICPPPSKSSVTMPQRAKPTSSIPGMHYVGAVTTLVSLSDTGYVCEVEVVKGLEGALDKQAVEVIRQQVFQPIRQDGKAIAGSMIVQRDFWRGDASDTLYSENAGASLDEIPPEAKSVHALDISSVTASGKVEGNTYRNQYFGVSFAAPGATVTVPSLVDNQANRTRLVDATAGAGNRDDRYSVAILVDRLSNYPELKSLDEYVEHVNVQLKQDGGERDRDNFAYTISGVEFVGAIYKVPDGPGTSHFRAIFSTVMRGYLLSLDVTAAREQQAFAIASSIEFKQGQ